MTVFVDPMKCTAQAMQEAAPCGMTTRKTRATARAKERSRCLRDDNQKNKSNRKSKGKKHIPAG
jgi:hypothetical protein